MIRCERIQHPVGQGFFHSASLVDVNQSLHQFHEEFSYVYDCGSLSSHARSAVVQRYKNALASKKLLDILFLSHLHADHVNGLDQLLLGRTVDTIVMPLLGVVERLILFIRTFLDQPEHAASTFFRDLIIDPANAMRRFRPRQIIFVRNTDEDQGPTGGPNDIPDLPVSEKPNGNGRDKDSFDWNLVGDGKIEKIAHSLDVDTKCYIVDDLKRFAITIRGRETWLLAPYVQGSAIHENQFFESLSQRLNCEEAELTEKLKDTDFLQKLVTDSFYALSAAYKDAVESRELNFASMSLYSGPGSWSVESDTFKITNYQYNTLRIRSFISNLERVGWLGTGDADLKKAFRLERFVTHFGLLLNNVLTITVPHHGSSSSSDQSLYQKVGAKHCVNASQPANRNWAHPATAVVHAVASAGAQLFVVNGEACTQFVEICNCDTI